MCVCGIFIFGSFFVMGSKREQVIMEIQRLTDSIKRKHRALAHAYAEENRVMEKRLKPITEPLHRIASNVGGPPPPPPFEVKPENMADFKKFEEGEDDDDDDGGGGEYKEEEKETADDASDKESEEVEERASAVRQAGALARSFTERVKVSTKANEFDHIYGIHFNGRTNQWEIGDSTVTFDGNQIIVGGDKRFTGASRGLYELLFLSDPQNYKEKDLKRYKEILDLSKAHLDTVGRVKRNTGSKYKKIISQLFPPTTTTKKSGSGGMFIRDTPAPTKYVYWNDVNELCERLRTLISSKQAGHTGHDNEIASIIEELRENGEIVGGDLKLSVSVA